MPAIPPGKSGITSGGDFEIDVAEIITSNGTSVPIIPNLITITIYEDIELGAVTGELLLHNSFSFSNIGPLIGQEYFKLKIRTPTVNHPDDIIDFTENMFHIYKVGARISGGESTEGLYLYFTTSEFMKNNRTRISKTFEGTYSDIVKKLLIDYLDCKKTPHIEPSSGVKKIVSPNLKPFDIIKIATREAVTEEKNSPTFLFYETLNGKYHFRSLDSLYIQESKWFYTTTIGGSKVEKGGLLNVKGELETLLSYNVSHNNMMNDTIIGVLGSKLITHDIFNKSYSEHIYNYFDNFDNEGHIDNGKARYSETPIDQKKNRVSDFTGRIFLQPTTIKDVDKFTDGSQQTDSGKFEFAAKNPDKWLQRRTSQIEGIKNGISVKASVHGNTVISAGDIITLDIPFKTQVEVKGNPHKSDRFLQGKFLLARVRHDFKMAGRQHSMGLTCVRDSTPDELESNDDMYEPKPSGGVDIVTNFYEQNE